MLDSGKKSFGLSHIIFIFHGNFRNKVDFVWKVCFQCKSIHYKTDNIINANNLFTHTFQPQCNVYLTLLIFHRILYTHINSESNYSSMRWKSKYILLIGVSNESNADAVIGSVVFEFTLMEYFRSISTKANFIWNVANFWPESRMKVHSVK